VKAGPKSDFLRVLHSAGKLNGDMVSVDFNKKCIYIDQMDNTIYSVNTQYAGNSVGFKKLAFRLAIRKASSCCRRRTSNLNHTGTHRPLRR